jgi:hypothetical protein
MRQIWAWLLVVAFLVLEMGCSSLTVYTDYDRNLNFRPYRTYRWAAQDTIPEDQLIREPRLPDMIHYSVDHVLGGKGFQKVDSTGKADLIVAVSFKVEKKVEVEDLGGREQYDPKWKPDDESQIVEHEYEVGTLKVSFLEEKSGRVIWRGWAVRQMQNFRKPERIQYELDFTLSQILSKFPPATR